jgi:hypothetical protein
MKSRPTSDEDLKTLIKIAKAGHPLVQYRLAEIYADWWDVPEDTERAIFWYRKAAEQGFPPAYPRLGSLLHTASFTQEGIALEAVKWLEKAALHYCELAAYWLSEMYCVALPYRANRRLEFDQRTPVHWEKEIPQSESNSLIWLDVCTDIRHSVFKGSDLVEQIRDELLTSLSMNEVIEAHERVTEVFEEIHRRRPYTLVIDDPISAEIVRRRSSEHFVEIITGEEWDQMIERLSRDDTQH